MPSEVVIVGLPEALAEFDPNRFARGLATGMQRVGEAVATEARAIVKPHHFHGTFEQQIHAQTTGDSIATVVTQVGVNAHLVPEARPISYGWPAGRGKQPPSSAIAEWLASKPELVASIGSNAVTRNAGGFIRRSGSIASVTQDSRIKGLAFVIARKIGRRGYSFAPLRPFERGWDLVARNAQAIIGAAIAKTPRA